MRVLIHSNYEKMSMWAAKHIADAINNHKENRPFVLGLPTGSTPLGVYKALIKLYNEKKVSFKNVVTFNMDEYAGLPVEHPESYHSFMFNNFFNYIDIPRENIHILNGMADNLEKECTDYEKTIASFGGIDLFMGGIGVDGHVAFNEPFSSLNSRTRLMKLTWDTRVVNSRFFDNDPNKVPEKALTVGVGTIMDSKEVMILINGRAKARALQHTLEEPVSSSWTCSALQLHNNGIIVCDEDACGEIKVDTYKYFKDIERNEIQ